MNNWDKMTPMEEIYAIRKEIAEENDYDLDRIFESARVSQQKAMAEGRVFVTLPIAKPRKPKLPITAAFA